jgi:hypothetical protein
LSRYQASLSFRLSSGKYRKHKGKVQRLRPEAEGAKGLRRGPPSLRYGAHSLGWFTEKAKRDALLTKNQSGRARFRHSVLRFEDFPGLDFCQAQIPVARRVRLRPKVENGHRSTILF